MGLLDKIKKVLVGGKDKADNTKATAAKGKTKVNEAADKSKRAADKAGKSVDDVPDDLN